MTLKKGDRVESGGYIWVVKRVNKKTVVLGEIHSYLFPKTKKVLKSLLIEEE